MKRGSRTGLVIKIACSGCGAARGGIRQRPVRRRAFENMGQQVPPRAGRRGRECPAAAEVARVINVRNPWAPNPDQLTELGDRGARASWPVAHRLAGRAFCRREQSQAGLTRKADMPEGMARGCCGAWRDAALLLASASDLCMGRMGV